MGADSYWARRSIERENEWNKKSRETIEKELASQYERSAIRIQGNIEKLYGKFARDNGLSKEEARKLITGTEYRTWRKDIEEYVKEYKETGNPKTLLELNTLAMRSRISRLDKLYSETLIELDKLGQHTDKAVTKFLKEAYKDNRLHSAYELAKRGNGPLQVAVDSKRMQDVLRTPWSGKNYSERIWKNSDKLAKTIQDTIVNGVHRGVSVNTLAKEVQTRMGVGKSDAIRLVRTELNYTHNQATLDSLREAKMGYFQFIATLDKRTSSVCRNHDNNVYPLDEAEVGSNVPPLHPRCRSTIAGALGPKNGTSGSRTVKVEPSKKGGTVKYTKVPRNMAYEDWKAVYVDKSKTFDEWKREGSPIQFKDKGKFIALRTPEDLEKVSVGENRVKAAIRFFDRPTYTDKERMAKNLKPLSDEFIKEVLVKDVNEYRLAKHVADNKKLEEFKPLEYTIGKDKINRWFTDDGTPLYPPNNGAIGMTWDVMLGKGEVLSRFGKPTGSYTAPDSTPFEARAMPLEESDYGASFCRYIVIKPFRVSKSVIAPAFNRVGGGIQYKSEKAIQYYLDNGYLKEV